MCLVSNCFLSPYLTEQSQGTTNCVPCVVTAHSSLAAGAVDTTAVQHGTGMSLAKGTDPCAHTGGCYRVIDDDKKSVVNMSDSCHYLRERPRGAVLDPEGGNVWARGQLKRGKERKVNVGGRCDM